MKNKYSLGEFAIVGINDYTERYAINGKKAEIIKIGFEDFDYQVRFEDGTTDILNHNELIHEDTVGEKLENPLIINTPTFNVSELPCGSLIYANKGYLQLQGFVAHINSKVLTLGYYDADEYGSKCSHETVDIERVISGEYTVELTRKAIPLELQGA